jgi:hypothetical protein
MSSHKQGFNIKGGLFTEFANRNKVVLDLNRHEKQHSPERVSPSLTPSNKKLSSMKIKHSQHSSSKDTLVDKANNIIEKNHLVKIRDALAKSMTFNK